jgi:LysR family nitrogen assimilation transcriptional regulator
MHRSAQGVAPTDAGRLFYQHALAILKQVADAKSAVVQSATRPSGSVTVGLPHSISGALALPLLQAARAEYPEITLQLTEEISGNLSDQLKSGRINLAVLFDDGQLGPFNSHALVEEELAFICRAGSALLPPATGLTLAAALACPLILPAQQQGVRPRIEQLARAAGLTVDTARVTEINSLAILRSALLADMGATILPQAPVQAELDSGALHASPILHPGMARTVALCASRNIPLTNAAAAVGQLIRTVTARLCDGLAWRGARLL